MYVGSLYALVLLSYGFVSHDGMGSDELEPHGLGFVFLAGSMISSNHRILGLGWRAEHASIGMSLNSWRTMMTRGCVGQQERHV
jgi:hypothetical protein